MFPNDVRVRSLSTRFIAVQMVMLMMMRIVPMMAAVMLRTSHNPHKEDDNNAGDDDGHVNEGAPPYRDTAHICAGDFLAEIIVLASSLSLHPASLIILHMEQISLPQCLFTGSASAADPSIIRRIDESIN